MATETSRSALLEAAAALGRAESALREASRSDDDLRQVMKVVAKGRNSLLETAQTILALQEGVREASRVLADFGSRAEDVSRVVDIIEEVADETRLLALNAKILAAQAGREGAGFTVVADKLMSLAANTRESTGQVADIMERLADEAGRSRATIGENVVRVEEGARLADEANDAFDSLARLMTDVTRDRRRLEARATSIAQLREKLERLDDAGGEAPSSS